MTKKIYTKIIGTGSYIPPKVIGNEYFLNTIFYEATGEKAEKPIEETIKKFHEITNIAERRWVNDDQVNSDIASIAAEEALNSAGVDRESLDFIISCHNFGDVYTGNPRIDTLPAIANRVKKLLNIDNPTCICHDLISGCPGWTQGMIVADAYIRSQTYRRGLVIGSDTLSRISDPYDRDCMIFSDGAGATVVEAVESEKPVGILAHSSRSDVNPYADLLNFGRSNNLDADNKELLIKMNGHKVYVYALSFVPNVVKNSIDKAGISFFDVKKVLIHQANEKMDEAILKRVCSLYGEKDIPENLMPMTINKLGNSSTATVPTLLDLVAKGKMNGHHFSTGDHIVLCSVGAGMNINSIVYKW